MSITPVSDALKAVREFVKDHDQVEFTALAQRIFGVGVSEIRPVQRAIVEAELVDCGWRRDPRSSVWRR